MLVNRRLTNRKNRRAKRVKNPMKKSHMWGSGRQYAIWMAIYGSSRSPHVVLVLVRTYVWWAMRTLVRLLGCQVNVKFVNFWWKKCERGWLCGNSAQVDHCRAGDLTLCLHVNLTHKKISGCRLLYIIISSSVTMWTSLPFTTLHP